MTTEDKTYRIIVSGGGTGGHIYPAIAIADMFRLDFPKSEVLFIGAKGKMEMQKVPQAGYPIEGLWISGIQRRLTWSNLLFPIKLLTSVWKAMRIIKQFKPDVVVGTGGYASGPTVIAAARKGIPVLLQEQNSFPGLTNRQLSRYAGKVCVAYPDMDKFFPQSEVILSGNPLRSTISSLQDKRDEGIEYFGLSKDKITVLVIGGSLGARTINESILGDIEKFSDSGIQIIWQTGKLYFEEMKQALQAKNLADVHITEFIDRMDLAYSVSDLAISRAGALSISELCLAALPVIFVPSPNVAEDHQTKNAKALSERGAARFVADSESREKLVDEMLALASDTKQRQELSDNIAKWAKPNAAREIVDHLKLIMN